MDTMPKKVSPKRTKVAAKHLVSGKNMDEYHTRLVALFLVAVCFFFLAYTMLVIVK
jgi:hypothetical protein